MRKYKVGHAKSKTPYTKPHKMSKFIDVGAAR